MQKECHHGVVNWDRHGGVNIIVWIEAKTVLYACVVFPTY